MVNAIVANGLFMGTYNPGNHVKFPLNKFVFLNKIVKFKRKDFICNAATMDSGGDRFLKTAGVIGAATATSKLLGLSRELVLAAVFGVGPVVDAFGYASIIPGFFLTVLGGINGPIHVTMTAALSKLSEDKGRELVEQTSATFLLISAGICVLVSIFAGQILVTFAPGISGEVTISLAILQLRIMAPCIILSCLMGIGYGRLSTSGKFGFASLSPALSSILTIFAAVLYSKYSLSLTTGGVLLAVASTLGAFSQWLLQISVQGEAFLTWKWENPFLLENIREVLLPIISAAVASGMLQFATYTDLYFASFFPQAAAALGYANLLVMAPLGIISSSLLIPMLGIFSRLSEPSRWPELRVQIRKSIQLCMGFTLLMTAVMVPLAEPIVCILFQRRAFDKDATRLVSSLLQHYVLGSTFYLLRDVLVRIFYALGDSGVPFYISLSAILANAVFDWFLIRKAGFGPEGLVMATSMVNLLSTAALWTVLSKKLQVAISGEWIISLSEVIAFAILATTVTALTYKWFSPLFLNNISRWIFEVIRIGISSCAGMAFFVTLVIVFQYKTYMK